MTETEIKLASAAAQLAAALTEIGWEATPTSPKDYQVKVAMSRGGMPAGNAVLYYSPKKGTYRLVTQELRSEAAINDVTRAWALVEGGKKASAQGIAAEGSPTVSTGVVAYVDGSYREGTATYGLVILRDGRVVHEDAGVVAKAGWATLRNVAGEMAAVLEALNWARRSGEPEIAIAFDYEGLEAWATGRWQANNEATRAYQQAVREAPVRISAWHKITAHTGDRWNERADTLAKSALPSNNEDPAARRERQQTALAEAYALIRDAAAQKGYVLEIVLDRPNQLKFSVCTRDTNLGSGWLYASKKDGVSLKLHECRDAEARRTLMSLWTRRHVAAPAAETRERAAVPGAKLIRTQYALAALSPYKDHRINLAPIRKALRDDLIEAAQTAVEHSSLRKELVDFAEHQVNHTLTWTYIESDVEIARKLLANFRANDANASRGL